MLPQLFSFVEACFEFISCNQYSKQKVLGDCIPCKFNIGMHLDAYELIFFQTWWNDRHLYAVQFDTSYDDPDLHSKSQGYRKAITSAITFFLFFVKCHEETKTVVMNDYVG